MFEELGLELPEMYKNNTNLFQFIHQSHKMTNQRMFKAHKIDETLSPFEVIETFNDTSRKLFMSDIFGSRLFYFVFSNFLEDYIKYVNLKYQLRAVSMICMVLR